MKKLIATPLNQHELYLIASNSLNRSIRKSLGIWIDKFNKESIETGYPDDYIATLIKGLILGPISRLSRHITAYMIEFDFNVSANQNCLGFTLGKKEIIDTGKLNYQDLKQLLAQSGLTECERGHPKCTLIIYQVVLKQRKIFSHASILHDQETGRHKHKMGSGPVLIARPEWVEDNLLFGQQELFFKKAENEITQNLGPPKLKYRQPQTKEN